MTAKERPAGCDGRAPTTTKAIEETPPFRTIARQSQTPAETLARRRASVANARAPGRSLKLHIACRATGRLVGRGALDRDEAGLALFEGAERAGLIEKHGPAKIAKRIARDIDKGARALLATLESDAT